MMLPYARAAATIMINGVEKYPMGPNMEECLKVLDRCKPGEEPPEGFLTATGAFRNHIYMDMVPKKWVRVEVPSPGRVRVTITAAGRKALRNAYVYGRDNVEKVRPKKDAAAKKAATKEKAPSLLDRQRAREAARRKAREAAASGSRGRKAA